MYQHLTLRKHRIRHAIDLPRGNSLSQSDFGKSAKKSHLRSSLDLREKTLSRSMSSHKKSSQIMLSSEKMSACLSAVEDPDETIKAKEMRKLVKNLSSLLKNPPKDLSNICSQDVLASIQRRLEKGISKNFLDHGHSLSIENAPTAYLEYILDHLPAALPKQMADLLPLVDHIAKNAKIELNQRFPRIEEKRDSWMAMQLKVRSDLLDKVIGDAREIETWYEKMQSTILRSEDDKNRQVVFTLLQDYSGKHISEQDLLRISSEVNMELEAKLNDFFDEVRYEMI